MGDKWALILGDSRLPLVASGGPLGHHWEITMTKWIVPTWKYIQIPPQKRIISNHSSTFSFPLEAYNHEKWFEGIQHNRHDISTLPFSFIFFHFQMRNKWNQKKKEKWRTRYILSGSPLDIHRSFLSFSYPSRMDGRMNGSNMRQNPRVVRHVSDRWPQRRQPSAPSETHAVDPRQQLWWSDDDERLVRLATCS